MFYILDDLGYIEDTSSHYIERDEKTCTEYTGTIPEGYDSLDDWILNANIRAYKIVNNNLTYDADRDAELQEEWNATNNDKTSQNIYSTEETAIGTWIDGKTLYRKVIDFGNLPNKTNKKVAHNINNVDKFTKVRGIATTSGENGGGTWEIPFANASTALVATIYINNATQVTIECNGADRSSYYAYVILEYTKTTD